MLLKEKAEFVSENIDKIIKFVNEDETVKEDFEEYLATIQFKGQSYSELQAVLIPYIFERKLTNEKKGIIELFKEKNTNLDDNVKEIMDSLENTISSIFEIKKIHKDGFDFCNLVNEKDYRTLSLVKMLHFRGVSIGEFAIARIFEYQNDFYILSIDEIIPQRRREDALRLTIAKQLQQPESVYKDNPQKEKEIQKFIEENHKQFDDFFHTQQIVTTNKCADNLLALFNNYTESGEKASEEEIQKYIEQPQDFKYFEVEGFSKSYDFIETASQGFSSTDKVYDITIMFEPKQGIFVIPFYQTFNKIFEAEDYKTIEGYQNCVKNFLENNNIPVFLLEKTYKEHGKKFLNVINEILDKNFTFDELIKEYKSEYIGKPHYSSTTLLYTSKAFLELMGFMEKPQKETNQYADQKIGRNDPCPCGSGKKYKKCCMLK